MKTRAAVAGIGALAFGVLTIVGLFVANAPGGSYSASDVADYIARGHRVAVFVAVYLLMLALFGLICALAYLREMVFVGPAGMRWRAAFWGTAVAAVAAIGVGWGIDFGVVTAHAFGGKGVVVGPATTYLALQLGDAVIWGPGALLLGLALVLLTVASRGILPGWVRAVTGVGAFGALTAIAFFPSGLVIIWAIAIGLWLLLAAPRLEQAAQAA